MRSAGVVAAVITYNVLGAFEMNQLWQRALRLLREMRSAGVVAGVRTYNVLGDFEMDQL